MGIRKTTEQFIEEAKRVHGDRYDYDKTIYISSQTKLIITCPTHGDFEQRVYDHLQGSGCPKCSGRYRPTTEEFISRSKSIFGEDIFDYSKVEYKNINTKVTLFCKKHGIEFEQNPISHLQGCISCPQCLLGIKGQYKRGYWTYEKCYEVAKKYEWVGDFMEQDKKCYDTCIKKGFLKDFTWLKRHYEQDENIITSKKHCIYKYEFPQFNSVYIGLTIDLNRRHRRGHSEEGSVYNFCKANNIDIPKPQIIESSLTIDEAKLKEQYWIDHYRESGYNLINKARGGSVGILCKIKSGNETAMFIVKARRVHGNKYDYSKVLYKNNYTKIIIICPQHGIFRQSPYNHLKGQGCSKCSGVCKLSTEGFVDKAKEIHGNKYDYSQVEYKNNKSKVIITCLIHGDFVQKPNNHLQGSGCPKCGKVKRINSNTKWTYEVCKIVSRKYKTRGGFYKGSYGAYNASLRNNWLDEFFPKK